MRQQNQGHTFKKDQIVNYDTDKTKIVDFLQNFQDKTTLAFKYMDAIVFFGPF